MILLQYSLGGLVRHLGRALYEHVGMAFVVLVCVPATVIARHRTQVRLAAASGVLDGAGRLVPGPARRRDLGSRNSDSRRSATWPCERSLLQTVVRTSHTVVGMLLFMTSVILLFRVLRIASTLRTVSQPRSNVPADRALAAGV